jgi:hypothetical protein
MKGIQESHVKRSIVLWTVIRMETVMMECVCVTRGGQESTVKYLHANSLVTIEDSVRKASVSVWKDGKERYVKKGLFYMEKSKTMEWWYVRRVSKEYCVQCMVV